MFILFIYWQKCTAFFLISFRKRLGTLYHSRVVGLTEERPGLTEEPPITATPSPSSQGHETLRRCTQKIKIKRRSSKHGELVLFLLSWEEGGFGDRAIVIRISAGYSAMPPAVHLDPDRFDPESLATPRGKLWTCPQCVPRCAKRKEPKFQYHQTLFRDFRL